jgi:gliding motility-associated-like protein
METAYDTFTWTNGDGVTYNQSGTYTYTYTNEEGCESVDTLHLTVHYSSTNEFSAVACESYEWDGRIYTTSGDHEWTYTNQYGADSVVTLHLTINHVTVGTDTQVACDSFTWINGETYTESTNIPTYTLTNATGCDSVVTLNLTINHATSGIDSIVACDSFTWINGETYTESTNIPTYTLTNAAGCDSVVTLNLTINHSTHTSDTITACDSITWMDGVTYTESTNTPTFTLTNAAGCDSVVTLNLTINHGTHNVETITACGGYEWHDTTYTESGTYTYAYTNEGGCESVDTLHLTMGQSGAIDTSVLACESFDWYEHIGLTVSGDYTHTITSVNGCDTLVTLHLTVLTATDTVLYATVVENSLPYIFHNLVCNTTGIYVDTIPNSAGCDSILTLNLTVLYNVTSTVDTTVCANDMPYTWHGHQFTAAGSYTVTLPASSGVDSVVTYTLIVNDLSASAGNITHVVCYGDSTGAATATVSGGQTPLNYQWINAMGETISTTTSITNRPAGVYTFTATDHLGCTATVTVTMNTLNADMVAGTISADQEVCEGENVPAFTGTAASGGENATYQWQISTDGVNWTAAPGAATAQGYTYPDPATTDFMLRRAWVSQSCGTVYSNTVTVVVWPNAFDTITAVVCMGEPYQENGFDITAAQNADAGEYSYDLHYPTDHCDSVVVLMLTVLPQSTYILEEEVCEGAGYSANGFEVLPSETVGATYLERVLTLQGANGCDSVVYLHLTITDTSLQIVTLSEDFCDYQEAELLAVTNLTNYSWSTGETTPNITVTMPGYYSVTAYQGECSSSAMVLVEGCTGDFMLPNAITPSNGDGQNDYFCIPESQRQNIALFEIYVYNRWGELVFYSNDKNFSWNGEYRGSIQYQTIYNYVITYTELSGKPHRKVGSVIIL